MTRDDAKRILVAGLLQRTANAVREADLGALREVCTDALKAKVHHDLAKLTKNEKFMLISANGIEVPDQLFRKVHFFLRAAP